MPTPIEILEGLSEITQRWRWLAVLWHAYYGVLIAGLLIGVRPSKPIAGMLLAIPLFSVSVLAWMTANPFNGTAFALLGLALIGLALRLPRESIAIGPAWTGIIGAAMIVFGWVYPHFLEVSTPAEYLYAAPTGLIPCPTLSMTIGLALVLGGFDARAWSLVLGATGVFYEAFGAFRLGVTIDLVLLGGALALVVAALLPQVPARVSSSVTESEITAASGETA